MSVQDEIREIQGRISLVSGKKQRAQIEEENATAKRDAALKQLQEEYGVTDNEGIKALHAELTKERDAALAAIREELKAAGV